MFTHESVELANATAEANATTDLVFRVDESGLAVQLLDQLSKLVSEVGEFLGPKGYVVPTAESPGCRAVQLGLPN